MLLMPLWWRRARRGMLVLPMLVALACDRAATEPTVAETPIVEVILEDAQGNLVYSHHDHWHGFPVVAAGSVLSQRVWFSTRGMSADDHDPPGRETWISLGDKPQYDLRVVVQDASVAAWEGDRAQGRFLGRRSGTTLTSFVVRRGPTTIKEAPPLNVVVR